MDRKETVPAPGKGRVPAGLYVLVEERLNARWAAARREQGRLEKHSGPGRDGQRGKRP